MQAFQFALPTMATIVLATAMLLPVRERRSGDRSSGDSHDSRRFSVDFSRDPAGTASGRSAPNPLPSPAYAAMLARLRQRIGTAASKLTASLRRAFPTPAVRGEIQNVNVPVESFDTSLADAKRRLIDDSRDRPAEALDDVISAAHACSNGEDRLSPIAVDHSRGTTSVPASFGVGPEPAKPLVLERFPRLERVVPITRLPLRSQTKEVTWFAAVDPGDTPATRARRHAFLAHASLATGDASHVALLATAYRQEDPQGRLLAMRGMMRCGPAEARDIFEEALRVGTDEERSLAVDGLVAANARDALRAGLFDRVEAIAAKAALALSGSNDREDFLRSVEPHVDAHRLEALLALLAGYLH